MLDVYLADLIEYTDLEGPGFRTALWFAGCSIRCKNCCNPHLFQRSSDQRIGIDNLLKRLERIFERHSDLEGISLLGGEPLDQPQAVSQILQFSRSFGLGSMLFSGFTIEQIQKSEFSAILDQVDLLVDGPFVAAKQESGRRWIGSSNQNLYFLSERYNPKMSCFEEPNEVELRWHKGELQLYGFPSDLVRKLGSKGFDREVLNLLPEEETH